MLKNRMLATQQASELEVGNEAYETLFHTLQIPAERRSHSEMSGVPIPP